MSIPKEAEPGPGILVKMLNLLTSDSDANRTLLAMANNPESCQTLRKLGCIPLLIQILHPTNTDPSQHPSAETKARAAKALKNIVAYNPDESLKRKEMKILKLLESLRTWTGAPESHPIEPLMIIMKYSFDEEHRKVMSSMGAIQAVAGLIQADIKHTRGTQECAMVRRYGCMTLSNLTFCTESMNKSTLCSMQDFMNDLSNLLADDNEDICGSVATVLRNLSWDANSNSIQSLQECSATAKLMRGALKCTRESTLKPILHALWNLSGNNSNKTVICDCSEDALKFLIGQLHSSKNLAIQQNAGGILRNVSTVIVTNEGWRKECLTHHLYEILLQQLKSSSLTIVTNACGTLCNLSSCSEAQKTLRKLNAIPMLNALVFSKHDRISEGAKSTLGHLIGWQENEPLDLSQGSSGGSPASGSRGAPNIRKPPFLNPPIVNLKTYSCPNFIENSADTLKTFCYEGTPNSHSITDLTLTDETVKYFTEHTPANFSRTSSLSSLNGGGDGGGDGGRGGGNENGGAVVGAPQQKKVQVPEDTPLMFSRCSSVESLESFGELPELPESDANSKYSNSVRQSEVVSPSELPDSPRNPFFPPIPKTIKCTEHQESGQMSIRSLSPLTVDGEMVGVDVKLSDGPPHEKKEEDELKFFAVEGTPFGISTSTSLSDLTCEFKDELEGIKEDLNELNESKIEEETDKVVNGLKILNINEKSNEKDMGNENKNENFNKKEEDKQIEKEVKANEDIYSDSQILMKCIRAGKASMTKSKSDYGIKREELKEEKVEDGEEGPDELAALILKGKKAGKGKKDGKLNKSPSETGGFGQGKEVLLSFPTLPKDVGVLGPPGVKPKECAPSPHPRNLKNAGSLEKTAIGNAMLAKMAPPQGPQPPLAAMEASTISLGSEWGDDTPTISTSIPSMSISTALRLVKDKSSKGSGSNTPKNNLNKPPDGLKSSFLGDSGEYIENIGIPSELGRMVDLESSMMSIASIRSEVAPLEMSLHKGGKGDEEIERTPPPIPPKPKSFPPRPPRSESGFPRPKEHLPSPGNNSSFSPYSPPHSGEFGGGKTKKIPPKPPQRKDTKYNTLPKNLGRWEESGGGEELHEDVNNRDIEEGGKDGGKKVGKLAGFWRDLKGKGSGGGLWKDVWVKREKAGGGVDGKPSSVNGNGHGGKSNGGDKGSEKITTV